MAHTYSHLYGLPTTGLRFFTVYGPWGRPDMSPLLFASAILEGQPIDVFNHGDMRRDFTYVDDVVEGVLRVLDRPARPNPAFDPADPDPAPAARPSACTTSATTPRSSCSTHRPRGALGKKAIKNLLPMQPGDVHATYADIGDLERDVGFTPARRSRRACGASWRGSGSTTGSDEGAQSNEATEGTSA